MASGDGLTEEEKRARWEEHCADERRDEEAAPTYNETVDAILFEMHERAETAYDDWLNDPVEHADGAKVSSLLLKYATRIEAALKRERRAK